MKTSAFPKLSILLKTREYDECVELHTSAIICNPEETAKKKTHELAKQQLHSKA